MDKAPRGSVPRVKCHFTLEPQVMEAVKKRAQADDRSASYIVNSILKENLNANRSKRRA
jgi:hypothetical protein